MTQHATITENDCAVHVTVSDGRTASFPKGVRIEGVDYPEDIEHTWRKFALAQAGRWIAQYCPNVTSVDNIAGREG